MMRVVTAEITDDQYADLTERTARLSDDARAWALGRDLARYRDLLDLGLRLMNLSPDELARVLTCHYRPLARNPLRHKYTLEAALRQGAAERGIDGDDLLRKVARGGDIGSFALLDLAERLEGR